MDITTIMYGTIHSIKLVTVICRYIYWSNWLEPRIDRCRLDGSEYGVFLEQDVGPRAKGLTIDYDNGDKYLYWCDARVGVIRRANMVTRDVQEVLTRVNDCAGVSIYGEYIYWTNS